jgi:hypothetical protein
MKLKIQMPQYFLLEGILNCHNFQFKMATYAAVSLVSQAAERFRSCRFNSFGIITPCRLVND